jgi:hypothetical protein
MQLSLSRAHPALFLRRMGPDPVFNVVQEGWQKQLGVSVGGMQSLQKLG